MNEAELIAALTIAPDVADALAYFDFERTNLAYGPVEDFRLPGELPWEQVGHDATGGAFVLVGETGNGDRPVVYAGSEGEGGLIAPDLRTALALVVGLPSLHDALSLPWGEDGAAVWARMAECDAEIVEDRPSLFADRARLQAALDLPPVDGGLLHGLHLAMTDERYRPIGPGGYGYQSM